MRVVFIHLLLASVAAAQAACGPGWGPPGEFPMGGVNGQIRAMATYDDGTGPALYVAGTFTVAGGVFANHVARWNGTAWSPLGTGVDGAVNAVAVHDDGSGMALYVGGSFTTAGSVSAPNVARWNGTSWSAVGNGTGVTSGDVTALAVHDDGSGAKLYAAGASGVGYWTGSSWIAIANAVTGEVWALASCNTGSGPRLYAGGSFWTIDGVPANKIACWNGAAWSNLGAGFTSPSGAVVLTLASWNDGSGTFLYAGGFFTAIAGFPATDLARWNGTAWSAPPYPLPTVDTVPALAPISNGSGTALYAAMGCQVAALTGAGWSVIGSWNAISVAALVGLATPSGMILYAGGAGAGGVGQWTGSSWAPLGSGLSAGVDVVRVLDDGTGPALYAGGAAVSALTSAAFVARRVGSSWSSVGGGFSGGWVRVRALATFDSGAGPTLHSGGSFVSAGGVPAQNIARWNGSSWTALGPGLNGEVHALAVGDLGQGSRLFAGGNFTVSGGLYLGGVAQWNGASWSPLGTGLQPLAFTPASADALIIHDDGSGPALYVGGNFVSAGGVYAPGIARWNGTSWSAVGGSLPPAYAFAVFDDGTGSALYATSQNGGSPTVIKWDGASWTSVGSSLPSGTSAVALALAAFDDGSGPALFAAGTNGSAVPGALSSAGVWRWDGIAWSSVVSGPWASIWGYDGPAVVRSLATFDDGGGPTLFAGGDFSIANGVVSAGVVKWTAGGPPVVLAQPVTQFADPGNPPLTLSVSAGGTQPLAYQWRKDGVDLPGASSPTLSVSNSPPGSSSIYDVVITNPCGTTTSQPATVFVRPVVFSMGQPAGAGSLKVVNARGKPGAHYFTAFTFNSANATSPGSGLWLGLHIPYAELLAEFATQGQPFVGVLDAAGASAFELSAGTLPASLSSAHVFGVTAIYEPATLSVLGGSTIASLVLL